MGVCACYRYHMWPLLVSVIQMRRPSSGRCIFGWLWCVFVSYRLYIVWVISVSLLILMGMCSCIAFSGLFFRGVLWVCVYGMHMLIFGGIIFGHFWYHFYERISCVSLPYDIGWLSLWDLLSSSLFRVTVVIP